MEYFHTFNSISHILLGKSITRMLCKKMKGNNTPVIVCIGTDRATGDCLGPLVGEQLIDYNEAYKVYGCLSAPVHALNIENVITSIYDTVSNPVIIAIDASLGPSSHVGQVSLSDSPLYPGRGVNKKLPAIGNISITGIVNVSGRSASFIQTTRLYNVVKLADCISGGLKYSIDYLEDFCPL